MTEVEKKVYFNVLSRKAEELFLTQVQELGYRYPTEKFPTRLKVFDNLGRKTVYVLYTESKTITWSNMYIEDEKSIHVFKPKYSVKNIINNS